MAQAAELDAVSPASELVVVTINAHQNIPDSARLTELANALRSRPVSRTGSFFAPDVIVMNETPPGVLASMRDQLNTLFSAPTRYEIAGTATDDSVKGKFLVNTAGVSVLGSSTWTDVCEPTIQYQIVNVADAGSGATLSVSALHLRKNYVEDGSSITCREKNATEARARLARQGTDGSALGDFNRRPVDIEHECDPEETSPTLDWYKKMTEFSTADGRSYVDTVRSYHRANGLSMANQWTQEWEATSAICNGSTGYRRNRIDYIFVSNQVTTLEATTDSPGWADPLVPGATACTPAPMCKYSDHRFVWARIALPAAPPPPAPAPGTPSGVTASAASSNSVQLAWSDVSGETSYAIERSLDGTTWARLGTSPADTTSFTDASVTENKTYRYRISATNGSGTSAPSAPVTATTPGTAPSASTLKAVAGKGKVTLSWTTATDAGGSGLAGYEVWQSTSELGTYTRIATTSSTSYTHMKLSRTTTYWYYVVALDGAANRGTPSNKAFARPN